MRVLVVALGLLALLAVAYAADGDAKLTHKSMDSYKKKHLDSYEDPEDEDSPKGREGTYPGFNRPYDHTNEHTGNCRARRDVAVADSGALCYSKGDVEDPGCPNPKFCGEDPNKYPIDGCICAENEWYRFGTTQVEAHFENQPFPFPMVSARRHSFECVDARGQNPMLGTPGGDLAEAMAAAMSLIKLKNVVANSELGDKIIQRVFDVFSNRIASPERPLYFHTDDGSLRKLFVALKGEKVVPPPSIFPWKAPTNTAELQLWLDGLKSFDYNGCGHVRLQLSTTLAKYYSVTTGPGAVQACANLNDANCVSATYIAQSMIEKFFMFWWTTPINSRNRRKIAFATDDILEGPLLAKAVAIIQKSDANECPGHYPLVRPGFAASQVFVYTPGAITDFRAYATERYFPKTLDKYGVSSAAFLDTWTKITSQQLGATLKYLNPANKVAQFTVSVDTDPIHEGDHDYGHHHHHHTSGHHYYSDSHDYKTSGHDYYASASEEANYDDESY